MAEILSYSRGTFHVGEIIFCDDNYCLHTEVINKQPFLRIHHKGQTLAYIPLSKSNLISLIDCLITATTSDDLFDSHGPNYDPEE